MTISERAILDGQPLSELALQAAIELENFRLKESDELAAVDTLVEALSSGRVDDLTLLPVYSHALSTQSISITSKDDLYANLNKLTKTMQTSATAKDNDLALLRDFCVALHEGLLNAQYVILKKQSEFRNVD